MGLFVSVPKGTQAGSDVANMSIMGYDPSTHLTGRGAIEAAALGILLEQDEIAFRCNLVTRAGNILSDYSSSYIDSEDGARLIEALRASLECDSVRLHAGKSFRNILVLKGDYSSEVVTTPPHDIVGQPYLPYLPEARDPAARPTENLVRRLILRSTEILDDHPVNERRRAEGLNPANMIWPWSPGRRLRIRPFKDLWGVTGTAISAVDTVRGLARSAGMDAPLIPGATGFIDTNYEGKANAALDALKSCDLVYVHVEAIDEMGHSGSLDGKIKAIEDFDHRLVRNLLSGLEDRGVDYRVSVIPDHFTPCTVRTHVRDPTPFVIASSNGQTKEGMEYNEQNARLGRLGVLGKDQFIRALLLHQPCPRDELG